MSNVAEAKFNNKGYFDVVCKGKYDAFAAQRERRKISVNEIFIEGSIESYGSIEGFRSFFTEKLCCGLATVSRATSKLAAEGKIEVKRLPNGKTEYRSARNVAQEERTAPFYRIYNFFLSHTFEFNYKEKKDKQGNVTRPARTVARRLTPAEALVLALIFTHSSNSKKKNHAFWSSNSKIADMLALSERQVERAIINLMAARLIFRPVRGQNRVRSSKFVANMKDLRKLCDAYAPKKAAKKETLPKKPEYVIDADARSDRDKYYTKAYAEAKAQADKYKRGFIQKAPRFSVVEKELRIMAPTLARAEVRNLPSLDALRAKESKLRAERAAILKRFNVDERLFEPQAWARCRWCGDTGTLSDGRGCTCFKQAEGVGELN